MRALVDLAVMALRVLVMPLDLMARWREDSLDEVSEASELVEACASKEVLLEVAEAFGLGRRCNGRRALVLDCAMTM